MAKEEAGKHGAQTRPELPLYVEIIIALVGASFIIAVVAGVSIIIVDKFFYMPNPLHVDIVNSHLDKLDYIPNGQLSTKINLTVVVKYDNAKCNNSCFESLGFVLQFGFKTIAASLRVDASDVLMNSLQNYVFSSSNVCLHEYDMDAMDDALKEDKVPFLLYVGTNAKWRSGSLYFDSQSVLRLRPLQFSLLNGVQ